MCSSYTKYENLIYSLIWQVLILKSPLSRQLGVQKPMLSGLTVALATYESGEVYLHSVKPCESVTSSENTPFIDL